MVAQDLLVKLLDLIPEDHVSVHQLTCKTGLDHRTIKKYLDLIIQIQNSKKIVKEQVGLRVLVRREK
jgi:transcriptional antiterminator